MKIFVANLPYHIKGTGLKQLFELFGAVISSKIIMKNGKSKGFGFLEMEDDQQARQAIKELDGSAIDERHIVVRAAESQSLTSKTKKRERIILPNFSKRL
jgi:RNA recognition motif-containing protein